MKIKFLIFIFVLICISTGINYVESGFAEFHKENCSQKLQNLTVDEAKKIAKEFVESKGLSLEGYIPITEKSCSFRDMDGYWTRGTVFAEYYNYSKDRGLYPVYWYQPKGHSIETLDYHNAIRNVVECEGNIEWTVTWYRAANSSGRIIRDVRGHPIVTVIMEESTNKIYGGITPYDSYFILYDLSSDSPEILKREMNRTRDLSNVSFTICAKGRTTTCRNWTNVTPISAEELSYLLSKSHAQEPNYSNYLIVAIIVITIFVSAFVIWYKKFKK